MPTLRSRHDFARIESEGRARAERLMVVRFVPNARDHDRYAISTSRKLGGAVRRNRVRRRLLEILRHHEPSGALGLDVLIVARPDCVDAPFVELRAALQRLLQAARSAAMTADR